MIAEDARLVAFNRCLRFGYVAHFVREWVSLRPFWSEDFRTSFDAFGSLAAAHVALALFALATLTQLSCAALGLLGELTPRLLWLSTLGLMLEAAVMPIPMPNHVALMLVALTFQAVMLLWRRDEPWAVRGLSALVVAGYAAAAIHKMNYGFLDMLDAVLWHRLPAAVVRVLGISAVGVELLVPFVALLSRRARPLALLVLLGFHFPMNSALGAVDYPWIATSFYPLFFSAQEWAPIESELRQHNGLSLSFAALSALLFVALAPKHDLPTLQGLVGVTVTVIWGYVSPVLLRRAWAQLPFVGAGAAVD